MRERCRAAARRGRAWLLLPAAAFAAGIDKQDFGQIERGHYLAIVGDCAACHTLPGSGHDLAGGRPIETPFGNLIAPNITPDPQTGIGAWTDDEFVNALTKGTGRDGTRLYPAMPYTYYTKLTRDDALAIRAYLNTVPAVHNRGEAGPVAVPVQHPPSHGGLGQALFHARDISAGRRQERRNGIAAPIWRKVPAIAACATRRRISSARDKTDERLQGYALQGWFAPEHHQRYPGRGSAPGRSTTSSLISRPAITAPARPPGRCRKRSICRPRI